MPQELDPKTREELGFTIRYALALGRGRVRDMQKDLDDQKLGLVVDSLIEQLLLSNWRIERGPMREMHSSHGMRGHDPLKKEPPDGA